MKMPILLIASLILFTSAPVLAASGSSSGSMPQQQARKLTPEEKAVVSYNAGIKHRDKAAKSELKLASERDEKKIAKLQKKIAKEYNKAIDDYEKAIGYYPHYFEVHSSLGYALRNVGRYEESLTAYNESLVINPSYGEAIEYRGEAYLGLNRLDEAKEAYMVLFQNDPALANELLVAMVEWVAERRDHADGLNTATVEEFAAWVDQRNELASYIHGASGTTSGRWEN